MQITTSAPRTASAAVGATVTPNAAKSSLLAAVRFQAVTRKTGFGQAARHVSAHNAGSDEADLFWHFGFHSDASSSANDVDPAQCRGAHANCVTQPGNWTLESAWSG